MACHLPCPAQVGSERLPICLTPAGDLPKPGGHALPDDRTGVTKGRHAAPDLPHPRKSGPRAALVCVLSAAAADAGLRATVANPEPSGITFVCYRILVLLLRKMLALRCEPAPGTTPALETFGRCVRCSWSNRGMRGNGRQSSVAGDVASKQKLFFCCASQRVIVRTNCKRKVF